MDDAQRRILMREGILKCSNFFVVNTVHYKINEIYIKNTLIHFHVLFIATTVSTTTTAACKRKLSSNFEIV